MPTYVAPAWGDGLVGQDDYPALNKPLALQHWLQHAVVPEEWILVIDPDMILRDSMTDWGSAYGAARCEETLKSLVLTTACKQLAASCTFPAIVTELELVSWCLADKLPPYHHQRQALHSIACCLTASLADPAHRGWAVSVFFSYMIGTHNNLSDVHIPEVAPRHDSLAGPRGRRSDQVRRCSDAHHAWGRLVCSKAVCSGWPRKEQNAWGFSETV